MMQVLAILQDSLRELRSRSLFWISLAISGLVAFALFGIVGFDETGWKMLWFDSNESEQLREGSNGARMLITWLFGGVFVWWWLSWGAIVLALISTSSIIPDMTASGAIDVTLAKPMSRVKLFLVKVAGATMFMALQVTVGVFISWLLTGLRFGLWMHAAWLSIPLLTLQFLYLFAPMALVGLKTRSPLASLIVVMLFWGLVSLVQFASNQIDEQVASIEAITARVEAREQELRQQAADENRALMPFEQSRIETWNEQLEPNRKILKVVRPWQQRVRTLELVVPKTADVQKIIASLIDAPTFTELIMTVQGFDQEMFGVDDQESVEDFEAAAMAGKEAVRRVPIWVSIGTSCAFTALVLAIACWLFIRRDF